MQKLYEFVYVYLEERMSSVNIMVKLMNESVTNGKYNETVKCADRVREALAFSGFEREVFRLISQGEKKEE